MKLTILLIVAALQVCTTNPICVEDEKDATKLFLTELEFAEYIGLSNRQKMLVKAYGLTLTDIMKPYHMELESNREIKQDAVTVGEMYLLCEILNTERTTTEHSSAQDIHLIELADLIDQVPMPDRSHFMRNSLCAYASQPSKYEMEASSFGMQFQPYMKFRFFKVKNQNTSGMERVKATSQLCCIYKGQVQTTLSDLTDEEMSKFEEHWMSFETAKTSQSFESVCDFLQARHSSITTDA